jgi:hypothetical protein
VINILFISNEIASRGIYCVVLHNNNNNKINTFKHRFILQDCHKVSAVCLLRITQQQYIIHKCNILQPSPPPPTHFNELGLALNKLMYATRSSMVHVPLSSSTHGCLQCNGLLKQGYIMDLSMS